MTQLSHGPAGVESSFPALERDLAFDDFLLGVEDAEAAITSFVDSSEAIGHAQKARDDSALADAYDRTRMLGDLGVAIAAQSGAEQFGARLVAVHGRGFSRILRCLSGMVMDCGYVVTEMLHGSQQQTKVDNRIPVRVDGLGSIIPAYAYESPKRMAWLTTDDGTPIKVIKRTPPNSRTEFTVVVPGGATLDWLEGATEPSQFVFLNGRGDILIDKRGQRVKCFDLGAEELSALQDAAVVSRYDYIDAVLGVDPELAKLEAAHTLYQAA